MAKVPAVLAVMVSAVLASSHNDTHTNDTTTAVVVDESTTVAPTRAECRIDFRGFPEIDRAGMASATMPAIEAAFLASSSFSAVDLREEYYFGVAARRLALTQSTPTPTATGNYTNWDVYMALDLVDASASSTAVATACSTALENVGTVTIAGQTFTGAQLAAKATVSSGDGSTSTTTSGSMHVLMSWITFSFAIFLNVLL